MVLQVILEGLGLGALLVLVCAINIRGGAVNMVHLYHEDVQERCVQMGLTTKEKIKRNSLKLKLICHCLCAGLCLRHQWHNGFPDRVRADVRHSVHHEPDRPDRH